MQAGNAHYRTARDLPETVAMFPLTGALLLPGGQMPLNIFEPRYIEMIDDALATNRLIGVVQPAFERPDSASATRAGRESGTDGPQAGSAEVCAMGSLGRITSFSETGDGRYIISLIGICRVRLLEEMAARRAYRVFRVASLLPDLAPDDTAEMVDRKALLASFKAYLDANGLEADWASVERAGNATLVNALAMMSPYGPAEKQALLEAPDLRTRAEMLVAITEISLARTDDDFDTVLQ